MKPKSLRAPAPVHHRPSGQDVVFLRDAEGPCARPTTATPTAPTLHRGLPPRSGVHILLPMLPHRILAGLVLAAALPAQITVVAQTWPLTGGTARGYTAVIDLTDPRVGIRVTDPLSPLQSYEAVPQTTSSWHGAQNNLLSINANYFGLFNASQADVIGISKNDGVQISPVRQFGTFPDPALVISPGMVATIDYVSAVQASSARWAVAGVGPSSSDAVPGTLLVTDGANTGSTARVDPLNRNPRTAIGTNAAGTALYIAVVDGRQTGWSVGMTLPELANVMIGMGSWRAINLDGGGSTSLLYSPPGGPLQQNRPSGGSHRAVANHLGFALSPSAVVGSPCGNGGSIGNTGAFRLGSANWALTLQGAQPGSLAFAALGIPGNEFSCGACTFLDPFQWTGVPMLGGSATWAWPVPNNPAFLGVVVGAQWLLLNGAFSPCPFVPGLFASARLHLELSQ